MQCLKKAIRAHSVQNAGVFDLLSERGHIVALRPASLKDASSIRFERIGRNKASTFTGLCTAHDNEIFRPIDSQPFDFSNQVHLLLLAYRSITRELHAATNAKAKAQKEFDHYVRAGTLVGDNLTSLGLLSINMAGNWDSVLSYRAQFSNGYFEDGKCADLVHNVILLGDQLPAIAVSSLFSFDCVLSNCRTYIVLNVFPTTTNETAVVFSYLPTDADRVRQFLKEILKQTGERQMRALSSLIIRYVENFFISPQLYNSWNKEKVKDIEDAFDKTLFSKGELPNEMDYTLFS